MTSDTPGQSGAKYPPGVTRARVAELHAKGLNQTQIGRVLGISRAAVSQHLQRLAKEAEEAAS